MSRNLEIDRILVYQNCDIMGRVIAMSPDARNSRYFLLREGQGTSSRMVRRVGAARSEGVIKLSRSDSTVSQYGA